MGTFALRLKNFGLISTTAFGLLGLPLGGAGRTANADAISWNPPSHGYVIDARAPTLLQHSGANARVTGSITFVGNSHGKPDSQGKCHNGKANGQGNGKSKKTCPPLPSLLDQLAEDGLAVQGFFPDQTVDVSSQLQLTGSLESIQVSFTSSQPLKASDLNKLTLQVVRSAPEVKGLQNVQAKLDVRIKAFNQKINELSAISNPSSTIQAQLADLRSLRDKLVATSNKITDKLNKGTLVVSQAIVPLQVDNYIQSTGLNSSIQGHFRIETVSDFGTAIEGMTTQFHTTITHLPGFPAQDDELDEDFDDSTDKWVARFSWRNAQVAQLSPQAIPVGSSIHFDYATPARLKPEDMNAFTTQLYAWDADDHSVGKLFGTVSYLEPVASDDVSPTWLSGSTPDNLHPYVRSVQPVAAQVQDAFGIIDPSTFQAMLSGTLTTGSVYNQPLGQLLSFKSPNQGQDYTVSGALGTLADGLYTFSLHAQDLAGNAAVTDPLKSQFRVDTGEARAAVAEVATSLAG